MTIDSHTTRAVIFDLNGTLIRDRLVHRLAFGEVLADYGIHLTDEEYEAKVTNTLNRTIWPRVLGDHLTEQQIVELSARKEKRYRELLPEHGVPTPGLAKLIEQLQTKGIQIALATTCPQETTYFVLDMLEVQEDFNLIITGHDISRGKPDPEIYLTVLDRLERNAEETVAFEDSPQGVQAATLAHIPTYGVLPEYPAEVLLGMGARGCITSFEEVVVS